VALTVLTAAAAAEQKPDKSFQDLFEQAVRDNFFTVTCTVPQFQPLVPVLKRGSSAPPVDELIGKFFGSREALLGDEPVVSPLWGNGRRYKSGMVVHLVRNEQFGQRSIVGPTQETEVAPVFLDAYDSGFVYCNNVPHTAVYATDIRNAEEIKKTPGTAADITYHTIYDEAEGQRAVEAMIGELFGPLKAPAGFQSSVQTLVQPFGERLFAYRVTPEYITSYELYDGNGKVVGTQSVGIPVYDTFVHVLLDGDKMLCGIEYFWDSELSAVGQPQKCISAPEAIVRAQVALLEHYKQRPPLLTIRSIKPGFVHNRKDRVHFVPAWLFDACYAELGEAKQKPNTALTEQEQVQVPLSFAINALTGELFLLY
jgi:hypothetical protein